MELTAGRSDVIEAIDACMEPAEVSAHLGGLVDADLLEVERWARTILSTTPAPQRRSPDSPWERRRHFLRRVAAEAAARLGRKDELLALLFVDWRNGASAARVVEMLLETERDDEAAVVARVALTDDSCIDRARIAAALESIGRAPDGWRDALAAVAVTPSLDAWQRLIRFAPDERLHDRIRNAIRVLGSLGVDGDVLFECATDGVVTPDAIELAERGLVDPAVVVDRGRRGAAPALGLWLGLAARAAFAHGDRFGVVRLLREAFASADQQFPPVGDALAIRAAADDDLNEMLDKAGIPGRR
jgi:hypothetical protein